MKITGVPFEISDWSSVAPTHHPGERGMATWRTRETGNLRIRLVEYSPEYLADHWCARGHVVLVLSGQLDTELRDGRRFTLMPMMSYQVADADGEHRSSTAHGAVLFVVD